MRSTHFVVFSVLILIATSTASHQFKYGVVDELGHFNVNAAGHNHEEVKMTTSELTLNLSGITFPAPAPQGDTLNLSTLTIPGTVKCAPGYVLKGDKCRLVNLLMMQNLDA